MCAFARAATAQAAALHMCTATSPLPPAATGLLQGVSVHAECSSVQVRMLHLRSITHCMHAPAQTSLHKCTSTTLPPPAAGLLQAGHSIGAAAHARQVGMRMHVECCSTQVRACGTCFTACMHACPHPQRCCHLLLACCRQRTASARQHTRDKSACARMMSAAARGSACGAWAAAWLAGAHALVSAMHAMLLEKAAVWL